MKPLRNICIIAHVDHGKTTLVDYMLRQTGTFKLHEEMTERVMDSMDLEKERGITILAKNTSVIIHGTKVNIVDTPGHADFGGEVERIMGLVDGAILLVDGAEGPLPQTRFVLQKALTQGLKIILVINKVDRRECIGGKRIQEVVNQTFDLFVDLGASDEQAHFPIVYACAREGWCTTEFDKIPKLISKEEKGTLEPLFNLILNTIPQPKILESNEFTMLVTNLSYSDYVGRLAIGRVLSGSVKKGQKLIRKGIDTNGNAINETVTVTQVYTFQGLKQVEVSELECGDIGVVSGSEFFEIGDSLVSSEEVKSLRRISVEKPTLGMVFSVNTSPMSGQEGEPLQSRKLKERLLREVRQNVALRFEDMEQPDQFRILGRGELQFAILVEQMRREGFEFMIGKPLVLYSQNEKGERLEPFENAVLDLPEQFAGDVTSLFQTRKGVLQRYEQTGHTSTGKRVRLVFEIPTRGLLGMRSNYLKITRGEGLFSTELLGFHPHRGDIQHRPNGALVSDRSGQCVEYGLRGLEDRGTLFVTPGVKVYEGMVVGEHNKENDLNVNPVREKKLSNMRAVSCEILVPLSGIRNMSLEDCIEWIERDEWIEVTPISIRMRKKVLQGNLRSIRRDDLED